MTSVIFATQVVDPDDPVLGFVVNQVRALVSRGARVAVVANEVRRVPTDLGAEVHSLGKELGRSRALRTLEYERVVTTLARRMRPATLLAHMVPVYLVLGAPALRATGGRTMLWYAHPRDSPKLALAEALSDVVLTTVAGTYPRSTDRLRVIGQAIDTERFSYAPPPEGAQCRLLALGRPAPVKGYGTILEGFALARQAGVDATLDIAAPVTTAAETRHASELAALCRRLGLDGDEVFKPGVPQAEVPARIHAATALVNATASGSGDKVIFEAMACGRPVVASNTALADLVRGGGLDLLYRAGDPSALAERVAEVAALAARDRARLAAVGTALRQQIVENHSIGHWAEAVMDLAAEIAARPPAAALARRLRAGRAG